MEMLLELQLGCHPVLSAFCIKDEIVLWITTIVILSVASAVVSFNTIVYSVSVPKSGTSLDQFVAVVVSGTGGT
jgi:hypothetical protein